MTFVWRALVVVVSALFVSACTNASLPYDRSSAGTNSITVVTPSQPNEASAVLVNSVGKRVTLVGPLVDAVIENGRSAKLRSILSQRNFSAATTLQDSVTKALEGHGYTIETAAHNPKRKNFLDAPVVGATTDAYLDIIVTAHGYQAADIRDETPWRPYLYLIARLVRVRDSAVLMQQVIAYNPVKKRDDMISITADPAYHFKDVDALVAADPALVVQGLRVAIEQSAQTLATLLR